MNTHNAPKRIYRLKNVSIDGTIIPSHIEMLKDKGKYNSNMNTHILKEKYVHLLHSLIRRVLYSEEGIANLNGSVLKTIYGNNYSLMIENLQQNLGIINRMPYEVGKHGFGYYFTLPQIELELSFNASRTFRDYESKLEKILEEYRVDCTSNSKKVMGDPFFDHYMQSLKMLKMPKPELAERFVQYHSFTNNNIYIHYLDVIESYKNLKIPYIKIDANNRIYHPATNTPRLLKPFLNIKFVCDVHNSHPLLFVSKIYDHHGICLNQRKKINSALVDIKIETYKDSETISVFVPKFSYNGDPFNHSGTSYAINQNMILDNVLLRDLYEYVCKKINCAGLCICGKNIESGPLTYDELFYILLVEKGMLWDFILAQDACKKEGLCRSDVKQIMFQEVFYSNFADLQGKKYAVIFNKMFPNVYSVVCKYKSPNTEEKLPCELMKLESDIFREVLKRLYRKRFRVINIHDAIVVLDVKGNRLCTPDIVKKKLQDVYQERGLMADVSIDFYGEESAIEVVEKEVNLQGEISHYLNEQEEYASMGDEQAKKFLEEFKQGSVELIPDGHGGLTRHKILKDRRKTSHTHFPRPESHPPTLQSNFTEIKLTPGTSSEPTFPSIPPPTPYLPL